MNPFSERVAAALALKGLAFERVVSDEPEDVARWSPIARTLPVLEIDGRRKADSLKIMEWLETLYPQPALYAADPKTAQMQRHLAEWSDDSFSFYWNRWRAARYPQPGDSEPIDDSLFARLRDQLGRTFGSPPSSRADVRELEIIRELIARMSDLVGFLGERPFFYANEPSVADISIYSMLQVLNGGPIPHCAEAIEERPTLAAFLMRVEGRIKALETAASDLDASAPAPP